ncbi:Type 1 glutamine amidotransferase-like domain-containing protein [Arthrobacter sp. AL12]|uniref:Type 1 glutamine amidotransferase-like domain-containing protein n=1 Tax=Arthrobacter sp. AL12 TaxID=3042241 RepID=UPI002499DF3C|nr:Type 1 glutamine amidotransferase-like domain-containing protein [Arthrobacter sp. AL12]MDI3211376.1 Type 1 glutamine amidotransferase-like domain-containing protein [Arthrobacter sp. AL12]
MSIFLVGGGPDTVSTPLILDQFSAEARHRAGGGRPPRIAVVLVDHQGSAEYFLPAYLEPLQRRTPSEVSTVLLHRHGPVDPRAFDGVDAIVVGGGPTPVYAEDLRSAAPAIRQAVAAGAPYLGFSAGAMVAPERAIVGGFRIRGVEVCPEEASEGLGEVELREGLGLVPFAVDVHAAQAGTLGRAVSAVVHGMVDRAVAVDENTALVLPHADPGEQRVIGTNNCWLIRGPGPKATVSVLGSVVTRG